LEDIMADPKSRIGVQIDLFSRHEWVPQNGRMIFFLAVAGLLLAVFGLHAA
jgi:hypothetical protein